jgi:hypothetical protein
MEKVTKILTNPAIKAGLKIAAPELVLGLDLVVSTFSFKKKRRVKKIVRILDKHLAAAIETIATTDSSSLRKEYEIRAHEILSIFNEWNQRA